MPITHRTRSNPGAQMSDTETKLRHAEWERFQAKGMGASDDKLAPLTAKIEALRAKLDRPKVERKQSTGPREHDIQKAFVEWFGKACSGLGVLRLALFAIPNGQILMASAKNPAMVMNYLKSEGFRIGVPDMMLAVPRGNRHGMFIEFKTSVGVMSDEQKEYAILLNSYGYHSVMCRSLDEAIEAVKSYLGRA
jgi:hypothetical protein